MSNYIKTTNFATKDSLPSGNPAKIVKGTEINTEFDNIAVASGTKADKASPVFTGTVTLPATNADSLSIGGDGVTVTGIKDEDDMASNSATKLASQQSIKAYVDSQVTAQDLDVTDGTTSISIDLDSEALSLLGGTGVTSTASGNGVTMAIDGTVATLSGSQTLTNKTLAAPAVTGALTTDGTIDGRDVAADGTKLDTVETNADVTDTTNVTAAGALMDSEVTNLAEVKAFDSSDYATAAQGTTADAALPKAGGAMTGAITTNSTFDGRDVATDGTKLDGIEVGATADQTAAEIKTAYESNADTNAFTDADESKLDGIEALADVTDATNVTAAGALMDSELTSIASVKALDQGVATTDSPTFANITTTGIDDNATSTAITIDSSENVGIGTSSPVTTLTASNTTQNDALGIAQVVNTTADDVSSSTMTVKNHSGTGQFMEWRTFGMRIGSRIITNNGVGDVAFTQGNDVEKMRLTATGLGIGTSSPSATLDLGAGDLRFTGGAGQDIVWGSSSADYAAIRRIDPASQDVGLSFHTTTNAGVDGAPERMRIDASGNVGIGESTPATWKLHIKTADSNALRLLNSVGSGNTLDFVDQSWQSQIQGNSGSLLFKTGGTAERMRIDSSGNLLVGKTYTATGNVGQEFRAGGYTAFTRSGGNPLELKRLASDGSLINFAKDGTSVGSIGAVASNYLSIGTGDTGILFQDDNDFIEPCNVGTSAGRDNAISLGHSGGRFKDLYLSSKTLYQASGGNQHSIGADANDLIIRSETAGNETARFTYGGNLLVGTTGVLPNNLLSSKLHVLQSSQGHCASFKTDATSGFAAAAFSRNGSNGSACEFLYNPTTTVGSISVTSSATSYNTSSDRRLKENIADADDAGSKIDAIQVRKYDWKADGSHQDYGMVAQELLEVAPEAVSVPEDAEEMMGVDYSKLVPMLIKEIQSLRNRVAQLEE